jgi:hypothetical protein
MAAELSLDEIEQKLAYLGKASVAVARRAVLAGANVIATKQQDAAIAAVASSNRNRERPQRKSTGALRRSIKARSVRATGSIVGAKSGFDVGKRKKDADPSTGAIGHHGHLFVGGTVRRFTGSVRVRIGRQTVGRKPTGNPEQNRGIMPANQPSFIRAAAQAAESQVQQVIHESLVTGIERAIDKLGG